jgi:hypothetical protein
MAMAVVESPHRSDRRNDFGVNPVAVIADFSLRGVVAHARLSVVDQG